MEAFTFHLSFNQTYLVTDLNIQLFHFESKFIGSAIEQFQDSCTDSDINSKGGWIFWSTADNPLSPLVYTRNTEYVNWPTIIDFLMWTDSFSVSLAFAPSSSFLSNHTEQPQHVNGKVDWKCDGPIFWQNFWRLKETISHISSPIHGQHHLSNTLHGKEGA